MSFKNVAKAFESGRVIPFLGAGVNCCGRSRELRWRRGQTGYLPTGGELAAYLAERYSYPSHAPTELARVSQYAAVWEGTGPLYLDLHDIFDVDYPPTAVHEFFARLPRHLRSRGSSHPCQIILTTNYDDLLERSFQAADEEFDLVSYVAKGEHLGKFLHRKPDGSEKLIERPNEYMELAPGQRTVILKIHGSVVRGLSESDSYVITEDNYIEFLTSNHGSISNFVPVQLASKLSRSHFLFIGYALQDWNLRVILQRLWSERDLTWKSWAVRLDPDPLDEKYWSSKLVEVLRVDAADLVGELSRELTGEGAGGL